MEHPLTRHFVPYFLPVLDMQQTYDMWLKKHNPGKPGEGTPISSREGEKQIQMPTDYADIMVMTPRACRRRGLGQSGAGGGAGLSPTQRRGGRALMMAVPPDGLPLLALRQEQQQQEAVAAAHPVREAQGEGLHVRQRRQWLGLPLPHGRVPALRQVRRRPGRADGQRAWGDEVVAPSGSSWPGGGAQLLLGVRSRGRGGTLPGPSLAALGQVLERVGTCPLSAGLKLQGETCGGRLSGQGLARGAAARVGRAQGSGSEPPAALHRLQKGKACPDGDKCRCAHGQEELNEWLDRREVLKQKLAKARKDMLLCPRDDDFGKYNFLLQEDGDAAGAAPEAPAAAPATVTGE